MQEHESPSENPVAARAVLEMITVANDFCRFMDKADEAGKQEILIYLQRVLPLIYLKSSLLPVVQVDDEEAIEHYVTETDWEDLFNNLRDKLGNDDVYHYIDLHETSHLDPVRASLAENITDLYQDLKDFLLLYQKPLTTFKQNAIMECRKLFAGRYGFRIVRALMAIHHLLYMEAEPEEFPQLFSDK